MKRKNPKRLETMLRSPLSSPTFIGIDALLTRAGFRHGDRIIVMEDVTPHVDRDAIVKWLGKTEQGKKFAADIEIGAHTWGAKKRSLRTERPRKARKAKR